jgi:hypothetical protein
MRAQQYKRGEQQSNQDDIRSKGDYIILNFTMLIQQKVLMENQNYVHVSDTAKDLFTKKHFSLFKSLL